MIEVTAGIIYKDNKILIARRAPHKHMGGYWEFPGGKIEAGETPEQCLEREIKEELGIKIKVGAFLKENEHDYGSKQILLKAYLCDFLHGQIQLKDHDQAEWIERAKLLEYEFAPADIPFVQTLLKSKRNQ
jgi:8-oxo-dGTP diphosphatase